MQQDKAVIVGSQNLARDFATVVCKKWKECDKFRPNIFKGGLNNDVKISNDLYARGMRFLWTDFDVFITTSNYSDECVGELRLSTKIKSLIN